MPALRRRFSLWRVTSGDAHCWCFDLPAIALDGDATLCLCPDCLKTEIARQDPRYSAAASRTELADEPGT